MMRHMDELQMQKRAEQNQPHHGDNRPCGRPIGNWLIGARIWHDFGSREGEKTTPSGE
jgi:hypothetical protein